MATKAFLSIYCTEYCLLLCSHCMASIYSIFDLPFIYVDVYLYFYFSMEKQDVGKFSVNHYSVQTNIDLLDNVVLCV